MPDKILALVRNSVSEPELSCADLFITLKWNVTTHHIIQQDTKTPHCQLVSIVTFLDDPLRRRVNMGT